MLMFSCGITLPVENSTLSESEPSICKDSFNIVRSTVTFAVMRLSPDGTIEGSVEFQSLYSAKSSVSFSGEVPFLGPFLTKRINCLFSWRVLSPTGQGDITVPSSFVNALLEMKLFTYSLFKPISLTLLLYPARISTKGLSLSVSPDQTVTPSVKEMRSAILLGIVGVSPTYFFMKASLKLTTEP